VRVQAPAIPEVSFSPPDISYGQLAPIIIVLTVAAVGILAEAFVPRVYRYVTQVGLATAGLATALLAVLLLAGTQSITAGGAFAIDGPTLFMQGTILVLALTSLGLVADRYVEPGGAFAPQASAMPGSDVERAATTSGIEQSEIYPLLMFAVGGMVMFPAANDLLTMFVALEVLSLPLYLLCGMARRRRLLSQEAALKYFMLGAFSSAFFLFGIALLYGYAGSLHLGDIADAVVNNNIGEGYLLAGTALVAVGLLFKVAAVPFHAWTPDVYVGAPTPITAFMAACTKVAAFGAMLRVFYVALGGSRWDWEPVLWAIAIATMLVGSILALTQTDVKRMLAYSSIAHAGFVLVGVVATSQQGLASAMFYLVTYGFATVGAFAVVTLVRDSTGEATHLSQWAGLGRRAPWLAAVFALFLLAFAGIPLTSGFTGKFAVFAAAVDAGATPLVVVAVVASAIAAFFYVRVIVLMFFSDPVGEGSTVAIPGVSTAAALAVCAAVTVVLGVAPQPVLDLAGQAAQFIR
jgi:NADH-quinone oxidoreductase subunit N